MILFNKRIQDECVLITILDDDTVLRPIKSPLIEREGDKSQLPPNNALTAGEWVQARYNYIPANYSRREKERDKGEKLMVQNIETIPGLPG